jgi:hypothetical protein
MRQRHIPVEVALEVLRDPDGAYPSPAGHVPDREVRWRRYDGQIVEVVIDMTDDTIVSVWITRVNP